MSTNAGKLPARHNEVAEQRGAGAAELAQDARSNAVVVRLRPEAQAPTLQPGGICLQQLSRQVARFHDRPARGALFAEEREELANAPECTFARDALGGIMMPTEGPRERAEEMRELSELVEVEHLWRPTRLVVEAHHDRLQVRV